ncbi:MAG: PEP-CTERM sorting domain-containing protein [Phycisphaerae bacterium]
MSKRSIAGTLTNLAAAFLLAGTTAAWAQSFTDLGNLSSGPPIGSGALGVSADGTTAVGWSFVNNSALNEAWRWTAATGMVGLGDLPGGIADGQAFGASLDGSVVVGVGSNALGFDNEGWRWTAAGGMVGLGDFPGGSFQSRAIAVSDDGSVVVGSGAMTQGTVAFRWTAAGGMVSLGDLPGGTFFSSATGVSGDGSVVVGLSDGASGLEAFRWTAATGMVGLGDLPGGIFDSRGFVVSADGAVVAGQATGPAGVELFRWTAATGMVGLGSLPGTPSLVVPEGATADGSTIVGQNRGTGGIEAFIWDATNGMRRVQDALVADFGLNLTGWSLSDAGDISDNGLVIVGSGVNPQQQATAWRADLAGAPSCTRGDVDNDGLVNGADVALFVDVLIHQNGTAQQICAGDLQTAPNGAVGLEDVLNFVMCLLAGGC